MRHNTDFWYIIWVHFALSNTSWTVKVFLHEPVLFQAILNLTKLVEIDWNTFVDSGIIVGAPTLPFNKGSGGGGLGG